MPSEKILDFQTFSHPLFDRFVAMLEERLQREAAAQLEISASTFDDVFSALMMRDADRTKLAVRETAVEIMGKPKMFDRLWDAADSYCNFLLFHGRRPTSKLLLNDVLYHIKTTSEIINPLRVFVSDKEFVKIYIAGLVGESFNVGTLDILMTEADVDKYVFPSDCVVKPTHLSGWYQALRTGVDKNEVKTWFGKNYYLMSREANYANLRPKIIVEPFLDDYYEVKVQCLFGEPKLLQSVLGGKIRRRNDYFTVDWNRIAVSGPYPNFEGTIEKPKLLDEILELSKVLSKKMNFVRIDFYTNDVDVKVGEITNCDNSGLRVYKPAGSHELLSEITFS